MRRRHTERVFRQRFCVADGCGTVFYICCCCDRGHRYCSDRCRQKARRQQCCEANRKHQQTPHGREDHRAHQQDYRDRQRQARLTDPSSLAQSASDKIVTLRVQASMKPAALGQIDTPISRTHPSSVARSGSDPIPWIPVPASAISFTTALEEDPPIRVTDHSSPGQSVFGRIVPIPGHAPQISRAGALDQIDTSNRWVVCVICRRRGLWKADLDTGRAP